MKLILQDLWKSKWQLTTIVVSAMLIALSCVVWEEREFLQRRSTQRPTHIPLNATNFAISSPELLARTGASISILWEVDITRNFRQSLVFASPTGRIKAREGRKAPLFSKINEENEFALHLLNGETFCGNLVTRSVIGQALLSDGIIFICRSPVISKEGLLIGYVTVGFKERPTEDQREEAIQSLRTLAKRMPVVN